MPDIWMDVDTALSEVPVNILPLIDDTDFKTIEDAIAYNAAGMDLTWNFVTTAGAFSSTAVTPTTSGDYDWSEHTADDGMYTIEIPASGGASINNDTEGFGWFTGVCTGVLPWRGPIIGFRLAAINNELIDGTADPFSDIHSRIVVVESSVDSDQTSRTAAISDVKSRLVVVELAIDSDQTSRTAAISDVKSELTKAYSDTTAIEAAGGALTTAQASQLSQVHSDVISQFVVIEDQNSDMYSRLVVVETAIDSDQTSRTAAISDIDSLLALVRSDTTVIEAAGGALTAAQSSQLSQVHSDVISQFVVIEDQNSDMYSRLIVVETAIDSDQTSRTAAISDIDSLLALVRSDTTAIEAAGGSLTAAQASQLSQVHSDVIVVDAAVSDVESSLVIVKSDTLAIEAALPTNFSSLSIDGSGNVAADVQEIDANAAAAGRLRQWITEWESGTVQADGGTTITLDAGGSSVDDFFKGGILIIHAGTGSGQARSILAYNGTSKVATIGSAFETSLSTDSDYLILPGAGVNVEAIGGDPTAPSTLLSDLVAIEAKASDTHSRVVVVEAAIDSDQASRTAMLSDLESQHTIIVTGGISTSDAVDSLQTSVDSDQVSRTAAISNIHSRLLVVESSIDSDQTSRTAAISEVKSELAVVSTAIATVDSAIDSDQTSRTAALSDIKSHLTVVQSETTAIQSDAALLEAAHAEPTGVPAANESPLDKLGYLFMALRNQVDITSTKKTFYDDGGTAEWEKDLSDDGTTYSETEGNAI